MGRSVDYLNNAVFVLYFPYETEESYEWDDLILNLQCEIKAKLPSYIESDKWDGRETKIILENSFCNIGISEYMGLVSLSVALKEFDSGYYAEDSYKENFANRHAKQIQKTVEKCLDNLSLKRYYKVGTFSNGEAIYRKVKV